MYYTNLEGTILVKAKNQLEALRKLFPYVYYQNNKPYGLNNPSDKKKTFLYKANVYKGKNSYTLFLGVINSINEYEQINKFDLDFKFIKSFRF